MGKLDPTYRKENPKEDRVYLTEAAAAMIWKSSLFEGDASREERNRLPEVDLGPCRFSHDRQTDSFTISGKIQSDIKAHSVVIANQPDLQKTFAGRIKEDGSFEVEIDELEDSNGLLIIAFCFENGFLGGNPVGRRSHLNSGFFRKYEFKDGVFVFADSWTEGPRPGNRIRRSSE